MSCRQKFVLPQIASFTMAGVASLSKQLCSVGSVHVLSAVEQSMHRCVAMPLRLVRVPTRKAMSFRAPSIALGTSFLGGAAAQVRWIRPSPLAQPVRADSHSNGRLTLAACMQRQKHCLPWAGLNCNAAHGPPAQQCEPMLPYLILDLWNSCGAPGLTSLTVRFLA